MRSRTLLGAASGLAVLCGVATASAQYGGYPPQPSPYGYGYPQPYGYAPTTPSPVPSPVKTKSTPLEIGYLYVTSAAWGVGMGVWVDAEAKVEDPGLRFIAPVVLGVAAPVGVWIADRGVMPRGLPSAIATGMIIGAGEGLGIASYQHVTADEQSEWSFRGLARAEVVGSIVGGAGLGTLWYFIRQSPKTNMFLASAVVWGTGIGTAFGGGASNGPWSQTNDSLGLGGLIGFNVALAGATGLSIAWTPSWNQLAWMWGGLGMGAGVSSLAYIFYAGSESDPRRGLIFQGVASTLGLAAGALIGSPDPRNMQGMNEVEDPAHRPFARVLGGSLMPVQGGMGAAVLGELW